MRRPHEVSPNRNNTASLRQVLSQLQQGIHDVRESYERVEKQVNILAEMHVKLVNQATYATTGGRADLAEEALQRARGIENQRLQLVQMTHKLLADEGELKLAAERIKAQLGESNATAASMGNAPIGERNPRIIPQDVQIKVTVRDGGRCRRCGSTENLQFDHVIPWSKGGANTINNVQLLCQRCNLAKGVS